MISRDGSMLKTQATGQSALAIEAVCKDVFKSDPVGILVEFNAAKPASWMMGNGG